MEQGDAEIIHAVLDGDTNAFALLVEKYQRYVFAILSRHLPNQQVAETANDVFFHAFQSLHTYQKKAPFQHWLAAICVRRCYEFWRKRGKCREMPLSQLSNEAKGWCNEASGELAQEKFRDEHRKAAAEELLSWALDQLNAEDRMVLTLIHLEDVSVTEAAAQLGWTKANVKVKAHRARKKMQLLLQKVLSDEDAL